MKATLLLVLVAACRFRFDAISTDDGGDGQSDTGSTSTDTPTDTAGPTPPLVQAAQVDVASGGFTINGNSGLAPVTAGNAVLVVCGHSTATGPCNPTSVPAATWQQIDGGAALGVWVACDAPAITSITLQNGAGDLNAVVTEWSGVVDTNCLDVPLYSFQCPAPPTSWATPVTPVVSQARELIVAAGMASAADAGFTIDAPFVMARNAKGLNSAANTYTAFQAVDTTPGNYTATGTIQASTGFTCFNSIFTFKVL